MKLFSVATVLGLPDSVHAVRGAVSQGEGTGTR